MAVIVITAGPTREYLDDVRFLSNASSGRMGCALASAAAARGHQVELILGPCEAKPPRAVAVHAVVSGLEMRAAAADAFARADVLIAAAAVSDWRPTQRSAGKPPRHAGDFTLALTPNPDIVAELAASKGRRIVVGFALQASALGMAAAVAAARDKLARKHLDLVVVNLHDALGSSDSEVVLCYADGRQVPLRRQEKSKTAAKIIAAATELWTRATTP